MASGSVENISGFSLSSSARPSQLPTVSARGRFIRYISNLRNKMVLNKLIIEKHFTMVKNYKYRNMLYRIELVRIGLEK